MGWSLSNPDGGNFSAVGQQPAQQSPWQQQPGLDPLGQREYAPVSIDDYKLPKSNAKWWLAGVAAVIIAALLLGAFWPGGEPVAQTTPSAAPSTRPVLPSSAPSGNAVAFTSQADGAEGYWEIQKSEWTDRGLELIVKVSVTRGSFGYSFFCLDNATTEDFEPSPVPDANVLRPGTLGPGESTSGLVVFEKDRGDTMVYLANRFGRQVSALSIQG